MVKAFVFGKFLPFHKGHEAMIDFALAQCDYLSVLVCCSDRESIPCTVRKAWIEGSFGNQSNLDVRIFTYLESEYPNTSVSSEGVSAIWASAFKKIFPDYSILVTSEPYGPFVAGFMGIEHIGFDYDRLEFPVSATSIRRDIFTNWKFLPDSVKPFYSIRVVVLGTESTGKTTLTSQLADYYGCSLVTEAGRDLIADSNAFSFEDLHRVAGEHAERIERATTGASPLLIIDTDIHITKSYSRFAFGKELVVSERICEANQADLYLYLAKDVPFVQDGTRLNEMDRNWLDLSHRQVLTENQIIITEISGGWNERFQEAVKQIDKLIVTRTSETALAKQPS